MVKTLFLFLLIALTAAQCDPDHRGEGNPNLLIVADDTEGTHEPTTLKIRVNQYNIAKGAGKLADGILESSGVENMAKDFGLDKTFSYAATLPNGEITRGVVTHALLPLKVFQFQYQNKNYQVTAIEIEEGTLGAEVKFEILPIKSHTSAPLSEVVPTESHRYSRGISDEDTFSDTKTDATFFVRSHDLSAQTVTGDLSLSNTERAENIILKPMQLIDFEHQGIKYQFGVRKIEDYDCEIFVRESPLN